MNLLMRFYNIKSGNIVIDGVDLEKFEEREIRKKIGLVLQDAFLFAGNVKQNIRMYNEEITDEEVKEALDLCKRIRLLKSYQNSMKQK